MSGPTEPVRSGLGWALTVLGVLWLVLSGGCTALFFLVVLVSVFQGASAAEATSLLIPAILVGTFSIGPGLVLLWLGSSLRRRKRQPD